MNKITKFFLKSVAKYIAKQGNQHLTKEYFGILIVACRESFTEDNDATLAGWLKEDLDESLKNRLDFY